MFTMFRLLLDCTGTLFGVSSSFDHNHLAMLSTTAAHALLRDSSVPSAIRTPVGGLSPCLGRLATSYPNLLRGFHRGQASSIRGTRPYIVLTITKRLPKTDALASTGCPVARLSRQSKRSFRAASWAGESAIEKSRIRRSPVKSDTLSRIHLLPSVKPANLPGVRGHK